VLREALPLVTTWVGDDWKREDRQDLLQRFSGRVTCENSHVNRVISEIHSRVHTQQGRTIPSCAGPQSPCRRFPR
jgi:hypothetical protein